MLKSYKNDENGDTKLGSVLIIYNYFFERQNVGLMNQAPT